MEILIPENWTDYELIDSGNGYRLERFGKYTLARPDPQIIWNKRLGQAVWDKADAIFDKIADEKAGRWVTKITIPEEWQVTYKNLSFYARLTPFKHTGIFPEQSVHWEWIIDTVKREKRKEKNSESPISILNLFAYTGIASLACASAGAMVTHVDASAAAMKWARRNQEASHLVDKPIRWILDDAIKFTQREVRRGKKYDGIIMDPPIFGHGASGEVWKFQEHFPKLLKICQELLSDTPLFMLINAYAISASALMLENVLGDITNNLGGKITSGELALKEKNSDRLLSTGIFGRWEATE